ncbi:MAG TPA: hypothetical protein H9879_04505 [Candidatus Alistipes intestinipullorum]|nr:hypothetical protein [Candidatus Alistipes intestinipullorum]
MIEKYWHDAEGYNPFLIRDGWQVAQLNYVPTHGLDDMVDVEVHRQTDEVFILFSGTAVLVAASVEGEEIDFECVRMTPGVTYNIPAGVWHNIGMSQDARMIIVERSGTHLEDCQHRPFCGSEAELLREAVAAVLHADGTCR